MGLVESIRERTEKPEVVTEGFNKYNAPEVMSQLLKALSAAGLDDTVNRLRMLKVPKIVNDAWRKRDK